MKREKILIIEDDMDILNLIDYNLTRHGFVTGCAVEGLEGVKKADAFAPDLVVLDLMLPGMDGWEVCRRLKKEKKEVPVVMLTAKCMPEDKVLGLETGADDYVTKPFNIKELIIRINNLLEKKRGRELDRMLYHEILNKVSTLGCYTDVLARKGERLAKEKRRRYIEDMGRQVVLTTELISEMSSLLDVESGGFRLRPEICDVSALAEGIAESYREMASHKGIAIKVVKDREAHEVYADRSALKQVLTNLVGNAAKYSGAGGNIEVYVKTAGEEVMAGVKDDGPGIPSGDLPHIFKKGFRAVNVMGKANGSGIGLYIVQSLLDSMGAKISVISTEGEGSDFRVHLKRASGQAASGAL